MIPPTSEENEEIKAGSKPRLGAASRGYSDEGDSCIVCFIASRYDLQSSIERPALGGYDRCQLIAVGLAGHRDDSPSALLARIRRKCWTLF